MELLGNIGVLEVAGHAMLDAVATARVDLIALESILSVTGMSHTYVARPGRGREFDKRHKGQIGA
jgi:hypothetical protein